MHKIWRSIERRRTNYIQWTGKVKHLRNYIDISNTDDIDFNVKRSLFNGRVNKLKIKANFLNLQSSILMNFFMAYCCSFYGSHLWTYCTNAFDKCCKAWNIAICNLLHLPYNAQAWLLSPFIDQSSVINCIIAILFSC